MNAGFDILDGTRRIYDPAAFGFGFRDFQKSGA